MKSLATCALLIAPACLVWSLSRPSEIPFEKITVDLGASETCVFADINGDGRLDIISGEYWYEGPKWFPHKFRGLPFTNNYIDNFSDLAMDVNGDGRIDIVSCSGFAKRLVWMENPGTGKGAWKEHMVESGRFVEFAFLVDLDNGGKATALLPNFLEEDSPVAWYEAKEGGLVRHVVSPTGHGHGIGAGDVNGDGRNDILTPEGWFEAPADAREGRWIFHRDFKLGATGFIYVTDVNGDGLPDIVTSLAHDYGIFWLEQGRNHQWTRHVIDDSWSQAHAMTLVDVNGDGQPDLLTGKRYMAHNGHDPGEREPLGIYWYEHRRSDDGRTIEWVKHVIDYSTRTGGGMQIPVGDVDGDGALDFAVAGKSGLFLFRNLTKEPPR